ncbi:flagellar assembly protein FliW [Bacillaceae bacterium W0354]
MEISTVYFGEVTIDETKIITFENGLPGFNDEREFVLIDIEGNPMFQVLQSVNSENLSFIVTDPFLIYKDYEFDLDDAVLEQLKVKTNEDLIIRTMVTVHKPFDQSTINLKAPIIINHNEKLAKQIVLLEEQYTTKHQITVKKGGE